MLERRYFARVPLIIPSLLFACGLGFVLSLAPPETLALRFSQSFFNILTVVPLSVVGFGALVIRRGIMEKKIHDASTTYATVDIGATIVLLGLGFFVFYVLD
jgi:hypothetical protein